MVVLDKVLQVIREFWLYGGLVQPFFAIYGIG